MNQLHNKIKRLWPTVAHGDEHEMVKKICHDTNCEHHHVHAILNHPLAGYLFTQFEQNRRFGGGYGGGALIGYGLGNSGGPQTFSPNDPDGDGDNDTPTTAPATANVIKYRAVG